MIQFQPLFCRWELAWGQVERCPWMPARAAILACCACGHFGRKRTSPPPSPFPTASALLRGGTAKAPLLGAPRPAAARGGAWRPHPAPPTQTAELQQRLQTSRQARRWASQAPEAKTGASRCWPSPGGPEAPRLHRLRATPEPGRAVAGVWSAEGAGRGWRGHPALLGRTVERPPGAPRLRTGVGEGRGGTGCGGGRVLGGLVGGGSLLFRDRYPPRSRLPISFWSMDPFKMLWSQCGGRAQEHPFVPLGFEPPSPLAPSCGAMKMDLYPPSAWGLLALDPPLGLGMWALKSAGGLRSDHQGACGEGDPCSGHKVLGDSVATSIQSLHSRCMGKKQQAS